MFDFILGNEKAIIGGLSAGILSLLSSVGITGQMTVKDAAYAVATWVITHVVVYLTTNSEKKGSLLSKADDLSNEIVAALHKVNDTVTQEAMAMKGANTPQVATVQTIPPEIAEAMAKQLAEQAKQPDLHAPGNADGSQDQTAEAESATTA